MRLRLLLLTSASTVLLWVSPLAIGGVLKALAVKGPVVYYVLNEVAVLSVVLAACIQVGRWHGLAGARLMWSSLVAAVTAVFALWLLAPFLGFIFQLLPSAVRFAIVSSTQSLFTAVPMAVVLVATAHLTISWRARRAGRVHIEQALQPDASRAGR